MFSGIVEATTQLLDVNEGQQSYQISLERPLSFDDVKTGDSIAVDGICLTVEKITAQLFTFSLGFETVRILNWSPDIWKKIPHNLERSLRLSDRLHGHLVTGHVDELGKVIKSERLGDNWFIDVEFSEKMHPYIWKKGSVTLHGVSLTVNEVVNSTLSVCLIPETQKRTNLTFLAPGDGIHIEADSMAKTLFHFYQLEKKS